MPQSTKREGFVLGPKGRLRSAAKQEPQTVGEMPCLYDNKKEQSMTAQILLAEREGYLPFFSLCEWKPVKYTSVTVSFRSPVVITK